MKKAVAGVSFRTTCGQQGGQSEHYDSDVRVYEVNSTGAIEKATVVKLQRANGECLGIRSRRRTCKSAKSCGELTKGLEPQISEWGNPQRVMPLNSQMNQ